MIGYIYIWLMVWNMNFMTSPIFGMMIQCDELIFSRWLKPPIRIFDGLVYKHPVVPIFLLKPGSKNRWIYLFEIKVWWLCALKPSNMLLGSPRFLRHLYHTMASWLIVIGLWFPYSLTQVLAHQCLIGTGMYVCRWKVEENGPSAFFSLQNPWGKIDQKCL
jgi:hypothetical protein